MEVVVLAAVVVVAVVVLVKGGRQCSTKWQKTDVTAAGRGGRPASDAGMAASHQLRYLHVV